MWHSLHFAFLAAHFWPGWCSGFTHLIHFPSIPGGFLDECLLFEEVCTPELFCPTFFPLVHFDLLLFPLFCLWSYAAKFTEELELSWDRATRGSQEKHLKFPINVDSRGPYKHHLVVRVDTGADVNCMNEKTFKKLFPEVKLSVCTHEIQNFGNSVADISILGQFCTYLQFRGEKYLNTFIVTNANDCPNLLSHGATFRMGVLLPNYPEENVVKGGNVPSFKFNTSTSTTTATSSNVFQILQDL